MCKQPKAQKQNIRAENGTHTDSNFYLFFQTNKTKKKHKNELLSIQWPQTMLM